MHAVRKHRGVVASARGPGRCPPSLRLARLGAAQRLLLRPHGTLVLPQLGPQHQAHDEATIHKDCGGGGRGGRVRWGTAGTGAGAPLRHAAGCLPCSARLPCHPLTGHPEGVFGDHPAPRVRKGGLRVPAGAVGLVCGSGRRAGGRVGVGTLAVCRASAISRPAAACTTAQVALKHCRRGVHP